MSGDAWVHTKRLLDDLQRRAVHEAGNAVACLAVGFDISVVTIDPERVRESAARLHVSPQGKAGFTGYYVDGVPASEVERSETFVSLAGPCAEVLLCGASPERRRELIESDDVVGLELSEGVSALGINVPRMYSLVFALGCWLAGLAGGLMAPMGSLTLGMDVEIIVECFVVVVVGGMGSIAGSLLGAVLIGEIYAFGILIVPRAALAFLFLAMTVVLIIRPWGLLGTPEKERA